MLAPAVLVAAILALAGHEVPNALSLPWIIGVPAGTAVTLFFLLHKNRLTGHPRIKKYVELIRRLATGLSPWQISAILVGMALYWTSELFAFWGALQLFDVNLGWAPLIIAYATGYTVTRRSLPLGGAGIMLVALSFALYWVGAPLGGALLGVLAYQVSNLVLPVVFRRRVPL